MHATTTLQSGSRPGDFGRKLHAINRHLLERGLEYFFPGVTIGITDSLDESSQSVRFHSPAPGSLEFEWLAHRYALRLPAGQFTAHQLRMISAMVDVLATRYQAALGPLSGADTAHIFRGVPEDRYVSAFLDTSFYRACQAALQTSDRLVEAIEVLRLSAMTTYENRRTSTGLILYGRHSGESHDLPRPAADALPYASPLTTTRSFHRLSDGMRTLALVDREGMFVGLVDVDDWSARFSDLPLPAPVADRYAAHSRATLEGGHICMILAATGEIKIFANGSQVFTFRDGRWHLIDTAACHRSWSEAVGCPALADRLYAVALNLAEDRRGALFLVLNEDTPPHRVVSSADLLAASDPTLSPGNSGRRRFHYLLRQRNALEIPASVLETVAHIDGAIVLDRQANLLSFGAILKNSIDSLGPGNEGSRTAAAIAASQFGTVLKVSEDGMISCFQAGECLWEI